MSRSDNVYAALGATDFDLGKTLPTPIDKPLNEIKAESTKVIREIFKLHGQIQLFITNRGAEIQQKWESMPPAAREAVLKATKPDGKPIIPLRARPDFDALRSNKTKRNPDIDEQDFTFTVLISMWRA